MTAYCDRSWEYKCPLYCFLLGTVFWEQYVQNRGKSCSAKCAPR